ncbi:nitronate monooxygenase family protein [Mycobacterium sp. TY814]|uniref:NAD(P)H-dependent flavin oxidoreductase n=1 Tax=unclassified Mycobacterium TaxID=2642494 RepID=UPI002741FEF9|nr:nitronate monooxygenase [Mycobacterium sp. TY814]MDP7724685.1 nitronate monooxygenase [Mycobacterium sp. TY814]
MTLRTRLTDFLAIEHPVLLAPMALVSGGRLAAAVTAAGGLGLVGGGYGDPEWLRSEIAAARGARVGYGFITWSLARIPDLLDTVLEQQPPTVMLSFGDLEPFADRIHRAGVALTAQVQNLAQAGQAVEAGADIIVAQGGEAGGHGMSVRSTFTLVPEVVDLVAERAPATLVVAAGGIADGRGLAAALALGADGVLAGTRFWASEEALVSPAAQRRAIAAGGDDTMRTTVFDIVRQRDWPDGYDLRLVRNALIERWHASPDELLARLPETISAYREGVAAEDFDVDTVLVGEAVGLIHEVRPAADILTVMVRDATRIMKRDND